MTKAELVAQVAQKTGRTITEASQMVEAYHDIVKENISVGITIRGFGTYLLKNRAEKTGRNISTGEKVLIFAHRSPMLKFSKEFKEACK
jgi:DNA-binding protein HU-beta